MCSNWNTWHQPLGHDDSVLFTCRRSKHVTRGIEKFGPMRSSASDDLPIRSCPRIPAFLIPAFVGLPTLTDGCDLGNHGTLSRGSVGADFTAVARGIFRKMNTQTA
jgi:hypothetical protein